MHETAVMQGMVKTIVECMHKAGASHVTHVQLVLGASSHMDAESARQHFALLTQGTPVEGASLSIIWQPALFQCFSCLHRFESIESATSVLCLRCGGSALEIEHKEICYVSAIDVLDADPHTDTQPASTAHTSHVQELDDNQATPCLPAERACYVQHQ